MLRYAASNQLVNDLLFSLEKKYGKLYIDLSIDRSLSIAHRSTLRFVSICLGKPYVLKPLPEQVDLTTTTVTLTNPTRVNN